MSLKSKQSRYDPSFGITFDELKERIVDSLEQEEILDHLNLSTEELVDLLDDEIWDKRKRFWYLHND